MVIEIICFILGFITCLCLWFYIEYKNAMEEK